MSNHIAIDPHVVLQHVDAHARAMAARNSGYVTAVLRADLHPDQWPDGVPLRVAVGLDGRRRVWLEGTDLLIAEQPAGPVLAGAGKPASPTLADRLARWLEAEQAAGRMPAKASARPALLAGRCSGVLVSLAGQRRAGRTVPASAAHRTGCALVLAPVLAAFLARDADTPSGWQGTPHAISEVLWPVVQAGALPIITNTAGDAAATGVRGPAAWGAFSERVALPGVGRVEVYRLDLARLGVAL